jgi:hypothetical protein
MYVFHLSLITLKTWPIFKGLCPYWFQNLLQQTEEEDDDKEEDEEEEKEEEVEKEKEFGST